MDELLKKIAKAFNQEKIVYAIGASNVLRYYKIVEQSNDIDIVVDKRDKKKAYDILLSMGEEKSDSNNSLNHTKNPSFMIDDIEVDLLSSFAFAFNNEQFIFDFDFYHMDNIMELDNISIPLMSLEDWYVLYLLMQKVKKVELIEAYFKQNGLRAAKYLHMALDKPLPLYARQCIQKVIINELDRLNNLF